MDDEDLEKTQIIRPGSADAPIFTSRGDSESGEKTVMLKPGQQPRARAQPSASPRSLTATGTHKAANTQTGPKPSASIKFELSDKETGSGNRTLLVVSLVIGVAIAAGAAMLLL